jgi:hypothetical protein
MGPSSCPRRCARGWAWTASRDDTPQSLPAGRGRTSRGSLARRGRRRIGQDPRPHRAHRAADRGARRPAAGDPRRDLHQQGRRRDARARRPLPRSGSRGDVDRHLPRDRCAPAAHVRRPRGPHARVHHLRRGRHPRRREAHRRAAAHRSQAVRAEDDRARDLLREERARRACRVRGAGAHPARAGRGEGVSGTRARHAPGQRRELRRPARASRAHPARARARARRASRSASSMCSSTSTRTPTAPSTSSCGSSAARSRQPRGGRRRRPVDLRLARGGHPQHPRLRARLPGGDRRAPRGQLSLHRADPRARQRGDLPERGAARQDAACRRAPAARR